MFTSVCWLANVLMLHALPELSKPLQSVAHFAELWLKYGARTKRKEKGKIWRTQDPWLEASPWLKASLEPRARFASYESVIGIQVVAHASREINIGGLNSSKLAPTPRKFHARKPFLLSFATLKHFLFVSKWFKDSYKAKKSRETPKNFFSTFHTINGILKMVKESYIVYIYTM